MSNFNKELDKLKSDLRIQDYLFIGMFLLVFVCSFLSYNLAKNRYKPERVNTKTDYEIELLQFDTIQVKTKTGEIHKISLGELEELIISNEI